MTGNDYTLYELNRMVRSVLESSLDEEYWVVGELSDATQGYGGHFYGELIEKEEDGKRILARARVTCWARTYNLLSLRFQPFGQLARSGHNGNLAAAIYNIAQVQCLAVGANGSGRVGGGNQLCIHGILSFLFLVPVIRWNSSKLLGLLFIIAFP